MSIEIGLLSLESILLVATIVLLIYSIKEGKQRDKLILEVGKATKVLTAGAEIMYSSCLMVHNIRFINVDDRVVVIGIPESTGEKEATKKGDPLDRPYR